MFLETDVCYSARCNLSKITGFTANWCAQNLVLYHGTTTMNDISFFVHTVVSVTTAFIL